MSEDERKPIDLQKLADEHLAQNKRRRDALKLTGCKTVTDPVIEKPASRHGEQR